MLHLNRDTMGYVLTWIAEGPWHSVCRLCCRSWATRLPSIVPSQHPSMPYCVAVSEQNEDLLHWLVSQCVPWSSKHIMSFCLGQKSFDSICWMLQCVPRANTLDMVERHYITQCLVRAGPGALDVFRGLDTTTDHIARQMKELFVWTPSLLSWVVRQFGSGVLHAQCLIVLDHCIPLCGGWNIEALYEACQYGEPDVVHFMIHHPQANFEKSLFIFTRALYGCVRRRRLGGSSALWHLVKHLSPDASGPLPLDVLPIAVQEYQWWFVDSFLADPQCPQAWSTHDIDAVAIAAVRLRRCDADIIRILQRLDLSGVSWHCPNVLFAAVDRPVTATLLQWLLRSDMGWGGVDSDMLLLRCILAGCHKSISSVVAYIGSSLNVQNTLFTTTAAELGDLALLKYLRRRGCVWDHHCLQMALHNNHMRVARWALTNGCPILAQFDAREEELRARLTRMV
jgi:hypothetical protein